MQYERALPFSLKKYRFLEKLGEGATSEVFLVEHMNSHLQFAAKVILPNGGPFSKMTDSFQREVAAITHLDHSGVIRPYDIFSDSGHLFLILEYCAKGSVARAIKPGIGIEPFEVRSVCSQIVSALKYCHSMNVAHRDIKPSNILIDSYGRVKLADFGLSESLSEGGKTSNFQGSLVYTAPEILQEKKYDPFKSDIFSLGVTLYQIATGILPWRVDSISEVRQAIISNDVRIPTEMDPELWEPISRMLATNPEERPTISEISALPYFANADTKRPKVYHSFSRMAITIPRCHVCVNHSSSDMSILRKKAFVEQRNRIYPAMLNGKM